MNVWRAYVRSRYWLRTKFSHFPSIYLPLADLKKNDDGGSVTINHQTDMVVEAFPRSGNTFVTNALRISQTKEFNLAHHLHAPAQLIKAAQLKKPALLIIRQPKDSVLSFVLRHPEISNSQALASWIDFYQTVKPYSSSFVTATFDQVTTNFDTVIAKINRRFNCSFGDFNHTKENVDTCFRMIERRNAVRFGAGSIIETSVARPSQLRSKKKKEAGGDWFSTVNASDLTRADELFKYFEFLSNRKI